VEHAFYGLCVAAGRQVLAAMAGWRCGAKNVPDATRQLVRGGTTRSGVVLGSQRIAVTKPRACMERVELELPGFARVTEPIRWTWRPWPRSTLACPRGGERSVAQRAPLMPTARARSPPLTIVTRRICRCEPTTCIDAAR
jgi:hypothetical protein